jgi:hypothetical protein
LYRLYAGFYPPQTALLLGLVFAASTTYWAYARIAYDILGACVGVCLLLSACADTLRRPTGSIGDAVRIILAFLLTCTFRFSLTPFLFLGLLGIVFILRRRWNWMQWAIGGALVCAGLLVSLIYNYVRTSELFKNGATGSYSVFAAMQGNMLRGIYGLLVSPNWGILWFAPILLLLFTLPWTGKHLPIVFRQLFLCFGVTSIPYILIIAQLNNWTGHSGWGPRYLVPYLPVFFLPVGGLLVAMWHRYRRGLSALILVSILVNLPSFLVNYRLAIDGYPQGRDITAPVPRQQFAVWRAIVYGLRNQPLPAPTEITADPIRHLERSFPDWWWLYLSQLSPASGIAAMLIALALALGGVLSLRAFRAGEVPLPGDVSSPPPLPSGEGDTPPVI